MPDLLTCLRSPTRRAILREVWESERAAGDVHRRLDARVPITFGAVSQHLRALRESGLVARRREGRFRYYVARQDAVGPLRPWLEAMWSGALDDLKSRAEAAERETP